MPDSLGVTDARAAPIVPLPPGAAVVIDAALARVVAAVLAQRPALARRLDALPPASLLVDPVDLPLRLVARFGGMAPSLRVARDAEVAEIRTAVRATLRDLLALAEARIDADAIFFDRTLVVDGEIEPVLALRNALESAPIDLAADALAVLGPLAGPARRLGTAASGVARAAASMAVAARHALLAPALRDIARLEQEVRRLAAMAEAPPSRGRTGRAT